MLNTSSTLLKGTESFNEAFNLIESKEKQGGKFNKISYCI